MQNLNNKDKKENNLKIRTATLFMLTASIILIAGTAVVAPLTLQSVSAQEEGFINQSGDLSTGFIDPNGDWARPYAPMAVSQDGNNVYIVWWTNKSENWEVMFRASNDGGQTFGDKINLSNSSDTESQNADIVAAGNNNVFVTWWETSPETGSSESVLRVSTDAGKTFGPMITLGVNGTISTTTGNTTESATTTTAAEQGTEELLPNE
ncbi:MAG: hypothetical protein ACJ707_05235 [Nitrososphaera sp.]